MAKSSTGTILLLGGAGVAVYGYLNGWFSSLGLGPVVAATPAAAAQAATQGVILYVTPSGTLSSTPTPYSYNAGGSASVPAPVSNPPYIVPAQNPVPAVPSGYTAVNTLDSGTVFLRNDVYATEFAKNIQVASPVANITMATIKSDAGLTAYNGFRGYVGALTGRYL